MIRRQVPLFLVGLLAFATTSCGGDKASPESVSPTTTHARSTTSRSTTEKSPPSSAPASTNAPVPPPPATHAALAYSTFSKAQTLDLWLPKAASSPAAVVVYIHGGAFRTGDSSMVGAKVQPLLDAGYAVASVNYRLSGEARFPAAVQDVKAAVRFLRASATTYNLDADRIALWGESAGAHLAAMAGATSGQVTSFDDQTLGNHEMSSDVQAVVDWYGPINFAQMDEQAALPGNSCTNPQTHNDANSPESAYIGAAITDAQDTVEASNPIYYLENSKALPVFSIAHGDTDCNVPYQQSEIFAAAINKAGGTAELTIIPGAGHGGPAFDYRVNSTIAWLDTTLRR